MITDASIEIDAAADRVWEVFSDVEGWPHWTASITTLVPLDGPALEVGHRFEIKQPRMPKVVWTVTAVDPGASWTWTATSPGNVTSATHWVIPEGTRRTLVKQRIDQTGPIGALVGLLMRRLTRRYLDMEGKGLKATSELARRDAPTS